MKNPAIYIMASSRNGTLYTGVTSDLVKRVYEHRNNLITGFSSKYNCKLLVFYETHDTMEAAISRGKQIKAGSRAKKLALIEAMNQNRSDFMKILFNWVAASATPPRNGGYKAFRSTLAMPSGNENS